MNKAILIILIIITVFLLLAFIVVFFVLNTPKTPPQGGFPTPTKIQLRDTVFDKFVPGKTTYDEVIKAMGKPLSSSAVGNKTLLTYPTKYSSLPDSFVFINNVLAYSIENFFGDYKKSLSFYENKYGQPELSLFDKNDDRLEWKIFPKQGVGLAVFPFDNFIVKILYFSPQTKEDFENYFLTELGLTKENPSEIEHVSGPNEEVFSPELESAVQQ